MFSVTLGAGKVGTMARNETTDRLWRQMHERLLAYITRRVDTPHDAEDILQDVFVRIHTHLQDLTDGNGVTAWVFRIARNAITDYYRRRASAARAMEGLAMDAVELEQTADEGDIEAKAQAEFAHCVEPLMSELPDRYRQALVLTELEGMSQADAAERLGLSVSGMKSRVQRGRSKFKDVLLDCCSVELDRRGGLVDYERREGGGHSGCDCQ